MDIPVFVFLCCILAAIGTLQLMGTQTQEREAGAATQRRPSALSTTLAMPSLLVPTALAAIGAWIATQVQTFGPLFASENPFGVFVA